ncbi:MAG: hypothetical protein KBG28_11435 [Kofleriaceae bacterium]|nr:hypothetical protein [Kofleriaceae bacterium]MBP6840653.1 hypothetical protein [Kofleriaceae bacterium]MBP9204569.1 hypothetical protein [Kofleriaceae bacterium]
MAEPTTITRWRRATTLAVTWVCLVGATFVALFARADTDDYAGWVLVVLAAQVAPAIGLARDRARPRPSWLTAVSVGVVAGLAVAWGLFMIMAMAFVAAGDPRADSALELGLLGLCVVAGVIWAVTGPFFMRRAPHPASVQRGLVVTALVGLVALLMTMLAADGVPWVELVLGVALPLAWAAPLLLWLRVLRPVPATPRARLVRG